MNIVSDLNQQYTYAEIAERIRQKTGRGYHKNYLSNVSNGLKPVSDSLRYNLMQTFPDFFLKHEPSIGVIIASIGEKASA